MNTMNDENNTNEANNVIRTVRTRRSGLSRRPSVDQLLLSATNLSISSAELWEHKTAASEAVFRDTKSYFNEYESKMMKGEFFSMTL